MDQEEFDAIVEAMQAEIDQQLDHHEFCELTCRELDDGRIMGILRPTAGTLAQPTYLISERDEDGEITHAWAEDLATESFFVYIMLYGSWANPTHGAVSPALSEFFAFCAPETPALVNWARWLTVAPELDGSGAVADPEVTEILVEAMIALEVKDDALADQMRRAVRGGPIGVCDPNQIELFSGDNALTEDS